MRNYSPAGYAVQAEGGLLLLDAGPGTLARLAISGLDYREIDLVLITHLHPDHTLDLVTLIQALGATPGWSRTRDLMLAGCRGLEHFIAQLLRVFPDIGPDTFRLPVIELDPGEQTIDGWKLDSASTGHTPDSLAYKLERGGRSLAYTGDAARPEPLVDLCREADLLISECSLPAGSSTADHFTAEEVGRLAAAAGVKRVLLTHLYPPAITADLAEQVGRRYAGPVEKAIDGMVIEL